MRMNLGLPIPLCRDIQTKFIYHNLFVSSNCPAKSPAPGSLLIREAQAGPFLKCILVHTKLKVWPDPALLEEKSFA